MKKVIIVGDSNAGLTDKMVEVINRNNICVLHNVIDSHFPEPKEDKVFEITSLPKLPKIYIDPHEPIFNRHKHDITCAKNRKKRKKRKRRK